MTMARIVVRATGEALSEEGIRAKYVPAELYRVSRSTYPASARFSGSTREHTMYMLSGECRLTLSGQSVVLSDGDVAELESGEFELEVGGLRGVDFVRVYPLYKWLPSKKIE